jgi:hypothetical protein
MRVALAGGPAPTMQYMPEEKQPIESFQQHGAIKPPDKDAALRRLRFATDEELAVFERELREEAIKAGASEQELRDAQRTHPEHG